jgi:hypothetical protein
MINLALLTKFVVGAVNVRNFHQAEYCFNQSYPGLSNISGCASFYKGVKK